jgi:DtxR family Mn-dependent transcriptional regulator
MLALCPGECKSEEGYPARLFGSLPPPHFVPAPAYPARLFGSLPPPHFVPAPAYAQSAMAEMHDATEEYLETILELEEEGITPIRARLVERLKVSAPAVSEQVNRLVGGGYTELMDDRSLRLTKKGRDLATSVVRRHRLAERLLVDVIGLEWEKVHREADRWEHAISADVEQKLVELLGDPATCPHGNPIPGTKRQQATKARTTLIDSKPGLVEVVRISEKIELDDDALRLLADAQLIPGQRAVVVGVGPNGVTVKTDSGEHEVPAPIATLMWVTAEAV